MNQTGIFIFVAVVIAFTIAGLLPGTKYTIDETLQARPFTPSQLDSPKNSSQQNLQIDAFKFGGACKASGKLAFNFLLDNSGSMQLNNRLENLKRLIKNMSDEIAPDSIVGAQIYGEPTKELIPYDLFEKNKDGFLRAVNSLDPQKDEGTRTFSGFKIASEQLDQATAKYPNYNWKLIHITDGCPNKNQDPTNSPNYPELIRRKGINIITIGVDIGSAGKCKNYGGKEGAIKLMQSISDSYIDADSSDLPRKSEEIFKNTNSCAAPAPNLTCTPDNKTNIELLVDNSGSMEDSMPELKQALLSFSDKLGTNNIIGLDSFSGGGPRGVLQQRFAIGNYDKTRFNNGVNSMSEDDDGATHMKDAFNLTKQRIDSYNKDSDYRNWTLIFLSDGAPKVLGGEDNDPAQDPRSIADSLKSKGMRIVSIALGNNLNIDIMKGVASNVNTDYFEAKTASELTEVYSKIFQSVGCKNLD